MGCLSKICDKFAQVTQSCYCIHHFIFMAPAIKPCSPDRKLRKHGKRLSDYHDIFTDHKLTIVRKRCPDCKYEPGSTIKTVLGHSMSADLVKLQTELGANHTYRESEQIFCIFSRSKRYINNHDRIKHTEYRNFKSPIP